MAKKQSTPLAAVEAKSDNVSHLVPANIEGDDVVAFAIRLGADLGAALSERADSAAAHMNRSQRSMLAAGLLLASIKGECQHGEFLALIEERGFQLRTAQRAMQYAQFVLSRPEKDRELLLGLAPSKVALLAGADPEVVESALEDGSGIDLHGLGVRELRQRIRDAEARLVDTSAERDTAIAERDGLAKQLRRRERDAEDHDGTPLVIADMRAESAALIKKAELALGGLYPLGVELFSLTGGEGVHDYIKPSLRLVLSGIVALRVQADGLIKQYADALGDDVRKLVSPPDGLAFLDDSEIKTVAEDWARLVSVNQHEAALREHEREQAKPKGKGRPKAAPKA